MAWLVSCVVAGLASAEPEYDVVDITNWTPAQLATLPDFHRFVPLVPAGAPAQFLPRGQAGGVVVGSMTGSQGYEYGVILADRDVELVYPLGLFYWERTWWDGKDLHFQNGRVSILHCLDISGSGVVVGESTIEGRGEYAYEYQTHAVLRTLVEPTLVDLTPNADRAAATGVNLLGDVCGWQTYDGLAAVGFRRSAQGVMTDITSVAGDVRPIGITGSGRLAGTMTGGGGWQSKTAFVCDGTSSVAEPLPLPETGPSTNSAAYDVSEGNLIVGAVWATDQAYEHFAAVWERENDGSWFGYELNEILADNPIDALLENAIAVNAQGYIIATGRLDGTDLFGSRLYLLTPTNLPPECAPDVNSDGILNFFDVQTFLGWFASGNALADLNSDNVLDFFDVQTYLPQFSAGCP
jgi:hypothetical protein